MTVFMVSASIAIAVYTGIAVYVVARRPHCAISWVFSAYCMCVAGYYLCYLFLLPRPGVSYAGPPLPLRLTWLIVSVAPTLFLHLTTFYWPSRWRRHKLSVLVPAYLVSVSGAYAALFTDLIIVGVLHRPPPVPFGPDPGRLMPLVTVAFAVEVFMALACLVLAYWRIQSRVWRRQVHQLFLPLTFLILGAVAAWVIVLTESRGEISRQLIDMMLIPAGFLLARAVLRYGALVGQPISGRRVFYASLAAVVGLSTLYVTTRLDHTLTAYTPFPYPLITGILILVMSVGGVPITQWIIHHLDRLLFPVHLQQQELGFHLLDEIATMPGPEQLQAQILEVVCVELNVVGGYVALPASECPAGILSVTTVHGDVSVTLGDQVDSLPVDIREPRLSSELPTWDWERPFSRGVALLCPLSVGQADVGVLALGTKKNHQPFTERDIALCHQIARQFCTITRMIALHRARDQEIEMAHRRDRALQQLQEEVISSTRYVLESLERPEAHTKAPLEIRVLGLMEVCREGERVPEASWGTEKAKVLLAYLLWRGERGATRDEILAALWPRRSIAKAANVFHVTVHRLRQALEPGLECPRDSRYIIYDGRRYRFNRDVPYWLDAEAFRELATKNDQASLRRAVALYRGSYLASMDDVLPTEVEIERRSLERLYAHVLRRLIDRLDGHETAPFLEKLVAVEPSNEAAQCAVVLGYMAQGRCDLARQQMARWRDVLSELNREPSPETKALWRRVEDGASERRG